jgi:hypothetical protein
VKESEDGESVLSLLEPPKTIFIKILMLVSRMQKLKVILDIKENHGMKGEALSKISNPNKRTTTNFEEIDHSSASRTRLCLSEVLNM